MRRIFFLILGFYTSLSYALLANGDFHATQSCPLYLSKNQQTNPDNAFTTIDTHYSIKEINRLSPQWFRVLVPSTGDFRWVHADCGEANYDVKARTPTKDKSKCHTPGLADGYVLALSWQPAFCESGGHQARKPECRALKSKDYAANHLVLHGLWPNQSACGIHYGYCNQHQASHHCDYAPLVLNDVVINGLKKWMPSFLHGSCLERHEWNKHGSCQILDPNAYFSLAMNLARQVEGTPFARYIQDNIGTRVSRDALHQAFIDSFGASSRGKLFLGCRRGRLVDVFISLPVLIPQSENLSTLIQKADITYDQDRCPSQIIISDYSRDDDRN